MQILLAVLLLIAADLTPLPQATPLIGMVFFVGSFLAATHDIAIDGYYLETLAALISILLIIALIVIGFKRRNIKKWLQHKGNSFF